MAILRRHSGPGAVRTAPMALALILVPLASLTGCVLPRSGPSSGEFVKADANSQIELVEPTMQDAVQSRDSLPTGFGAEWRGSPFTVSDQIGVGDILSVVIFEQDGLNLFPAGAGGGSRIEGLVVDNAGYIQIPYAGQVSVAGLTPRQARSAIVSRLSRVTFSPDVLVSIVERRSQSVTVQGDVIKPGPVSLTSQTNRLSALLSSSAPTPANLEVATVTVRRNGQSATVRLSDLYDHPQDDIALYPGDVVIVRSATGTVNVLGAAGQQGRVRILRRNYSVLDAVSDARGLNDSLADPAAVYLMRLSEVSGQSNYKPKVYHFDFRNPTQLAVAGGFALRDGDALLIANASFAQSQKVLSVMSGVLNTARSAATIAP